jgi:hypothetical protein
VVSEEPVQDALAVGRERDGFDESSVSGEGCDGLTGARIPQPRRLVCGAGQDARVVG